MGDYVFAAAAWGDDDYMDTPWGTLTVIDATDSADLKLVARVAITGWGSDVAVRGDFAFLTVGSAQNGPTDAGLRVFDIGDPAAPNLVGTFRTAWALHLKVMEDRAYMLVHGSGLNILDVTDPTDPKPLGVYENFNLNSYVIVGNLAYAASDGGLQIIDISDPTAPELIGQYPTSTPLGGVAVWNGHLYVREKGYFDNSTHSQIGAGLRVFDVSAPSSPKLIGSFPLTEDGGRISVTSGYLFDGAYEPELLVLDVSNPKSPVEVAGYKARGWLSTFGVFGRHAYFADSFGLGLLDITPLLASLRIGDGHSGPEIRWDLGILQFAPALGGPWTDLPAASPMPFSPIGDKGFFRVNVQPLQISQPAIHR